MGLKWRPKGHYIVEELFGMGTVSWCLKCHEEYSSLRGYATREEISEAFDEACSGNWAKSLSNLEWQMNQLIKKMDRVRKWMAFDRQKKKANLKRKT